MNSFKELSELLNKEDKTKEELAAAQEFLSKHVKSTQHYEDIVNGILVPQLGDVEYGQYISDTYQTSLDRFQKSVSYLDAEASATKRALVLKSINAMKKTLKAEEDANKLLYLDKAPRGTQLRMYFDDNYCDAKTSYTEKLVIDDPAGLMKALVDAGLDSTYTEVAIKTTLLKNALKSGSLPVAVTKCIHLDTTDKVVI